MTSVCKNIQQSTDALLALVTDLENQQILELTPRGGKSVEFRPNKV